MHPRIVEKENPRLTFLSAKESMTSGHRPSAYPQLECLYHICSTAALLCLKASQSCSTLFSPPTPPAALPAPYRMVGVGRHLWGSSCPTPQSLILLPLSLFRSSCLGLWQWRSVGHLPHHPTHLVQLPDPSVPPALLEVLLTTISSQLQAFTTSPMGLSLTPCTSQPGSPDPLGTCPTGAHP